MLHTPGSRSLLGGRQREARPKARLVLSNSGACCGPTRYETLVRTKSRWAGSAPAHEIQSHQRAPMAPTVTRTRALHGQLSGPMYERAIHPFELPPAFLGIPARLSMQPGANVPARRGANLSWTPELCAAPSGRPRETQGHLPRQPIDRARLRIAARQCACNKQPENHRPLQYTLLRPTLPPKLRSTPLRSGCGNGRVSRPFRGTPSAIGSNANSDNAPFGNPDRQCAPRSLA